MLHRCSFQKIQFRHERGACGEILNYSTPLKKTKLDHSCKGPSRKTTLCCHISVTKCKCHSGHEHAYCTVWKDAFWSSNNWMSPTVILSSYAALSIPANWKFWWWLSAMGSMVWDLDVCWEIRAWSQQAQPMPHFRVIPLCCEVWIAVVSVFLHVLCHNLKDLEMVLDIKQHL